MEADIEVAVLEVKVSFEVVVDFRKDLDAHSSVYMLNSYPQWALVVSPWMSFVVDFDIHS
jgi:hypothetical protein